MRMAAGRRFYFLSLNRRPVDTVFQLLSARGLGAAEQRIEMAAVCDERRRSLLG
ncbi:type III secretion system effector domain protein [Xanthomonas citri pv. punicae str. LMG 859]|nr:type III secretion system effector domain protein [Xanthomonas citri pv. punicae str. LMG 859]